jgi:hypothetical protein
MNLHYKIYPEVKVYQKMGRDYVQERKVSFYVRKKMLQCLDTQYELQLILIQYMTWHLICSVTVRLLV